MIKHQEQKKKKKNKEKRTSGQGRKKQLNNLCCDTSEKVSIHFSYVFFSSFEWDLMLLNGTVQKKVLMCKHFDKRGAFHFHEWMRKWNVRKRKSLMVIYKKNEKQVEKGF